MLYLEFRGLGFRLYYRLLVSATPVLVGKLCLLQPLESLCLLFFCIRLRSLTLLEESGSVILVLLLIGFQHLHVTVDSRATMKVFRHLACTLQGAVGP